MTKDEQIRFIKRLSRAVTDEMVKKINAGQVPDNWDGNELRQWLGDSFQPAFAKMERKRMQEYRNTVLANNL